MKVVSAEFVTSGSARLPPNVLRDEIPQFAFTGRSNVGKSSLLNALLRDKIARTSAAAGKTRLANVFCVTAEGGPGGPGQWRSYFVDLPGYGYARGGPASVRELAEVVNTYLASSAAALHEKGAVFLLVDSRHPGLASDLQVHRQICETTTPRIIATKVDKLSQSERARHMRAIDDAFGTRALAVSVTTGEGIADLWDMVAGLSRGQA
ncbi:MAG: ribosome biogenesis GTP-binding protein YihA/YsxC [Vicinamibacterales bacterium]